MPPKKELHYFDRSDRYPSPKLPEKSFANGIRRKYYYLKELLRGKNRQDRGWAYRYMSGSYNDKWYESLFDLAKNGNKCGEITPAYSMLDIGDIRKIYDLVPRAKIIFLMRDPLERAWSQFKYI